MTSTVVAISWHVLLWGRGVVHHGVWRYPLENVLQYFWDEDLAVVEDLIEGMRGTQLPALFLMVGLWGLLPGAAPKI